MNKYGVLTGEAIPTDAPSVFEPLLKPNVASESDESGSFGYYFKSITFSDGTKIDVQPNSIVLLTGPNNCGKSQVLRDLSFQSVAYDTPAGVTVQSSVIDTIGSKAAFLRELLVHPGCGGNESFITSNFSALGNRVPQFLAYLRQNRQFFDAAIQCLCTYVGTSTRLSCIQTVTFNQNVGVQPLSNFPRVVRSLFEDEILELRLHRIIRSSFECGILINRYSFHNYRLHYLNEDEVHKRSDRGSQSFARWFEEQPLLDDQGDGIRSFCAVVALLLDRPKPLMLIDEPEAFLHPPQIRQLARVIAQNTPNQTQLIIATHSSDFVQGLLEFGSSRVNVIRMRRAPQSGRLINRITRLSPEHLTQLWTDPLLRTSDVLTSLFHEVAVIVEGDSDARFFRAMIDAVSETQTNALPDLRFYHFGGKDRVYRIASALRAVGVPTVCVVDIDVLDDRAKFVKLYESFGGDKSEIEELFSRVTQYISSRRSEKIASDAKLEIDKIFADIEPQKSLTSDQVNKLRTAIRNSSAWWLVKQSGRDFFMRGQAYNDISELLRKCEDIGLVINCEGELENLCKCIGGRKTEWLSQVLGLDLANDERLDVARTFVEQIILVCQRVSKLPELSDPAMNGGGTG